MPESWVRTEERAGRLPGIRLGKYVRFKLGEVERVAHFNEALIHPYVSITQTLGKPGQGLPAIYSVSKSVPLVPTTALGV